jgi:hypothetical protein
MSRYLILGVSSVGLLAACAYLSGKAGYNAARRDSMSCSVGVNATYLVTTLERLHAGDLAQAESMLEATLDGEFMARWVYDRRSARFVSFLRPVESDTEPALIGTAAQYRASHPSTHPSPKVRADIAEVVAKYQPFAIKPQT